MSDLPGHGIYIENASKLRDASAVITAFGARLLWAAPRGEGFIACVVAEDTSVRDKAVKTLQDARLAQ